MQQLAERLHQSSHDLGGESELSTIERTYVGHLVGIERGLLLLGHDMAVRGPLTPVGGVRGGHDARSTRRSRGSRKRDELLRWRNDDDLRRGRHRRPHHPRLRRSCQHEQAGHNREPHRPIGKPVRPFVRFGGEVEDLPV